MPDNVRARRPGWCVRCRRALVLGERIWPRDPHGWLCEPCGLEEQPTAAAQLAARLNYRAGAGMTTALSEEECAGVAVAFARAPTTWRPRVFITDDELDALRTTATAGARFVVDTRRASVLYELLHATLLPPVEDD